jgi:hypothetical protein
VATSSFPSPFKSASVTLCGFVPTAKFTAAWNVPSPLPNNTATSLEP